MNLNAAVSASPGRGLLPVFISLFASVNLFGGGRSSRAPRLHPKVPSKPFGTEVGARRGTLDAMSRRKLGSRPQHLSAIQGKPRGAAAERGHVFNMPATAVVA